MKKSKYKVGDIRYDKYGSAKVIGIVQGYLVIRRTGRWPFVETDKGFEIRFPMVKP